MPLDLHAGKALARNRRLATLNVEHFGEANL